MINRGICALRHADCFILLKRSYKAYKMGLTRTSTTPKISSSDRKELVPPTTGEQDTPQVRKSKRRYST